MIDTARGETSSLTYRTVHWRKLKPADHNNAFLRWVKAGRPGLLLLAARHYDRAVADCISLCVKTCTVKIPQGGGPHSMIPEGGGLPPPELIPEGAGPLSAPAIPRGDGLLFPSVLEGCKPSITEATPKEGRPLFSSMPELEGSSNALLEGVGAPYKLPIPKRDGPPTPEAIPEGAWAVCEAPARIDLAGGWSDTPPVCFEAGGLVINAAVTVDGLCPIGAR